MKLTNRPAVLLVCGGVLASILIVSSLALPAGAWTALGTEQAAAWAQALMSVVTLIATIWLMHWRERAAVTRELNGIKAQLEAAQRLCKDMRHLYHKGASYGHHIAESGRAVAMRGVLTSLEAVSLSSIPDSAPKIKFAASLARYRQAVGLLEDGSLHISADGKLELDEERHRHDAVLSSAVEDLARSIKGFDSNDPDFNKLWF